MTYSSEETTKILRPRRRRSRPEVALRTAVDRLPHMGEAPTLRPIPRAPTTTIDWDDEPTLTVLDPDPEPAAPSACTNTNTLIVRPLRRETRVIEVDTIDVAPVTTPAAWFGPLVGVAAVVTLLVMVAI